MIPGEIEDIIACDYYKLIRYPIYKYLQQAETYS